MWVNFYTTGSGEVGRVLSSSFAIDFEGTEAIPTITLLTHAEAGHFNHSNNPTFIDYGQNLTPFSSSTAYRERSETTLKNIVPATYTEVKPAF